MSQTEPRANVELSTILVSYNTRELTLKAVQSLLDATEGITSEVLLVDNASVDGTVDAIRRAFPSVRLIENSENVGFARAVNQAAHQALGDVLLLLNPDCVIEVDVVDRMLGYLRAHPEVGALAPLVQHPRGRLKVASAGHLPTATRLAIHYLGLVNLPLLGRRLAGLYVLVRHAGAGPLEVEWVSGACLMTPMTVFRELGGLSTRWFMYAEDMDYCARVRDQGNTVIHLSDVRVWHEVGASSDGASTMWIDSMEDFYVTRWRPGAIALAMWRLTLAAGLLLRSASYAVRAVVDTRRSDMWKREARNFTAFARHSARTNFRRSGV